MARPVIIGTGAAEATTVTIPTGHQLGDVIFIQGFRDGSTTAPTIPAGWTTVNSNWNTTQCSACFGWKVAASSAESSGTWTNATNLMAFVLRGADIAAPIGTAFATQLGTGASVQWNALTDASLRGNGNWRILLSVGHRSTDTTLETLPTGATLLTKFDGATADMASFAVTADDAWPTTSTSPGGTSSGWLTIAFAVRGTQYNIRNDTYRKHFAAASNTDVMRIGGIG